VSIDDHILNSSLYIKKDKKNANKNKKGYGSALIALDTMCLGHFETYVIKEGNDIRCQFKLESKEIENLVRENIHKLEAQLGEYKYVLESFSFIPGGKSFTLLDTMEDDRPPITSETIFDAKA
jgi:hypothetical protein